MTADRVWKAFTTVAKFATEDDDIPVLTCVHMHDQDGDLVLEATDSYCLARAVLPGLGGADISDRLVPVPRFMPRTITDWQTSPGGVTFVAPSGHTQVSLYCPDQSGTYPNTDLLLVERSGQDESAWFNPAYLLKTLGAAAEFGNGEVPCGVTNLAADAQFVATVRDRLTDDELTVAIMPVRVPDA